MKPKAEKIENLAVRLAMLFKDFWIAPYHNAIMQPSDWRALAHHVLKLERKAWRKGFAAGHQQGHVDTIGATQPAYTGPWRKGYAAGRESTRAVPVSKSLPVTLAEVRQHAKWCRKRGFPKTQPAQHGQRPHPG